MLADRGQSRSGAALSRVTVTLVASDLHEEFLAILGISRRRGIHARRRCRVLGLSYEAQQRRKCENN